MIALLLTADTFSGQSRIKSSVYLSIIGVVVFLLILLIIYLVWKIRKEKRFRKELAAAGLLYFKEGVTRSLNPDLGIDEQAELLPYDEKFEFPAEKLILGTNFSVIIRLALFIAKISYSFFNIPTYVYKYYMPIIVLS